MKQIIKHLLEEQNPFVQARRKSMQRRLENKAPSFLCPNCIGGILFHDLGAQFCSPTVNLMLNQRDFVRFVINLDAYLDGCFTFFRHPEYECPCAYLEAEGLERIAVHFTHYHSEEEALEKWNQRKARIDRENLFVFLEERDGLTKEDIMLLAGLPVRGLVVFTANRYDDIPYAVQVKKYAVAGEVGNILEKSHLNGGREYEHIFDFVKWFNEANGGNFDVAPYVIGR